MNPQCHEKLNADNFKELLKVNTVVCEETNFWIGGFKHMMKHMNANRYNVFLFIISTKYNEEKTIHNREKYY